MELNLNLQKTDLGLIPSEWSIVHLDEISAIGSGKRLPLGKSLTDKVTPYPYIRVTDMHKGSVELSGIKYVPEDVYPSIKNYRIWSSDIFISVAGNGLGQVGKIPKELDGANLTENANRIFNLKCSQNYLFHVMASPIIQKAISGTLTVGAQPKLALTRIRKFKIPLPPTSEEQNAIAESLSKADERIKSLEKLVSKKRQVLLAAMQELLSGRLKLTGFKNEFTLKSIGDFASIQKGSIITSKDIGEGDIPVIAGGKTPAYYHTKSNRSGKTITISASGANAGYLAFHTRPIFASDCSTISENKNFDIQYLYYSLKNLQDKIYQAQTGGAQPHIHPKDIAKIQINFPVSLDEQRAIAQVLSDMEREIEHLEFVLNKFLLIKQGMVKELLTGKVRLI